MPMGHCLRYLLTVRGEIRIPSFNWSSSAMRSSPQVGFPEAIRRIRHLSFTATGGSSTGLDFQRKKWRKADRCQPIRVPGLTITNAARQSKRQARRQSTKRSAAFVGLAFFSRSWNKAQLFSQKQVFGGQPGAPAEKSGTQVDTVKNQDSSPRKQVLRTAETDVARRDRLTAITLISWLD